MTPVPTEVKERFELTSPVNIPTRVSVDSAFLTTPGHYLTIIQPGGSVRFDGPHETPGAVGKTFELYERLDSLRQPAGTQFVMITSAEVPVVKRKLNDKAVAALNSAASKVR